MTPPLFDLIARLAIADEDSPITKFKPARCWHRRIDDHWEIWVNGHKEAKRGGPKEDIEVQPFHCYVEFNGFPAGIFSPFGGAIAAGALANEETFAAALEKAIKAKEE